MASDGGKRSGDRGEHREGRDAHVREHPGPGTGTPPGAIEGAIMEGDDPRTGGGDDSRAGGGDNSRTEGSERSTTGAGAEATEGLHATRGRDPGDRSSLAGRPVGRDASGGVERAGSEPVDRETEHKGSYGGEGGKPRTSSDQRD